MCRRRNPSSVNATGPTWATRLAQRFPGVVVAIWLAVPPVANAAPAYDAAIDCGPCDAWNQPQEPIPVAANSWYVGVAGLSAVLVDTGGGLVLIDGGLPQSAPLIDANIRALGFRPEDIAFILVSHVHYDHVGGIAALQRLSGATVLTGEPAVAALESGALLPDDPQYDPAASESRFPAVQNLRPVGDRESIDVGDVTFTGHRTPGHTPGGMTWTWQSCAAGGCRHVVYADSLSPISVHGYRFSDGRAATQLRDSAARIAGLPCDIFLSNHPVFFDMATKLKSDDAEPFMNRGECRSYANRALRRLERRLQEEAPQ